MNDLLIRPIGHSGQALPSGTVTFLFTDIEGSTKLAQQYPEAMPVMLARHHEILRQAIQAQSGYIFQNEGDSLAVAFHSAIDALNAALSAQQMLQEEPWSPAPIKVRMGIHTGAAQLNDTSAPTIYTGYATVATTQRVMSAGHGGQILLSGATRELVRDALPANTELVDLGEKRLKDLLRPEHIYQINIAGLPSTFATLKTLDVFPNNLPVQLTSFVGRENEIAELKKELEEHRLVTLTGSGGTGKTRLSLQVAADLLEKFDHGVWFVELAPLTDPDLIPQTILSAIGIIAQPNKTPLDILKEYLHEKKALIVLDNCEHLVSASAQMTDTLLNAAPGLKVLASSREALGVKGELSYPVPSLALPDVKHLPTIEQLSQYEAVRLFIDRALLVSPHFDVDKDNAPFIAQICYRLDGIPLAIELATARIKMMSIEQISQRLADRFRLLTGGARTALPRQQTLRALIDWSYDILTENERLLLRRLSVFAGGWTLEAAEQVCSGDGIETYEVLDLLTQLVNKSLVVVIEHSQSEETRYRMLETIRQYAREKLLEARGGEQTRDQHLFFFTALAEKAESELFTSKSVFWINHLRREQDNIRAALAWSLEKNVEMGLRLASAQVRYWIDSGSVQDGRDWLSQLLDTPDVSISMPTRAKALNAHGVLSIFTGRNIEGMRLAEEGLSLYRQLGDRKGEAFSLFGLGVSYTFTSDLRKGRLLAKKSLEIYKELGDKAGIAEILTFLGGLGINKDYQQGRSSLEEGLALFRELGAPDRIAWCLSLLGRLEMWNGDFTLARKTLEEALAIQRQIEVNDIMETIIDLGVLTLREGDLEQARLQLEEGLQICQESGRTDMANWALVHLGYVALRQGDQAQAYKLFVATPKYFVEAASKIGVAFVMEGLASLAVMQNKFDKAVQIFAWADAARDEMGDRRPPVEQADVDRDFAVIRSHLEEAAIVSAFTAGRAMTMEQAIAFALEE